MSSRTPSRRGASKATSKKKTSSQSKIPGWLWLVTGFAAGFFVAFLIRLTPSPIEVPAQVSSDTAQEAETSEPNPVFDFYTVLPESEVVLPEARPEPQVGKLSEPPVTPVSKPEPRVVVPSQSAKYLLQAGSFRSAKDADRLKAQLLLAGQTPRVVKVTVGAGESWHRVQLGPFDNQDSLDKARSVLADFKVEGLLLRMK